MQSSITTLLAVVVFLFAYTTAQGFTVGPSTHPSPVTNASISKISTLAAAMYSRWQVLDSNCDPRAVFAVTYLYMTANALRLIQHGYFDNGNKMADFIVAFAGRYSAAFDAWAANDTAAVSGPWRVAFSFGASGHSDVTQDLTLGMNAHINFDLPIATFEQGYTAPQLLDDYYRVNDLMAQIDTNITHALGRYDPQFYNTDFLSESYFQASIDLVTSWRTSAYATAQAYKTSLPLLVSTLEATNEVTVTTVATGIAVPYLEPTSPARIAYCMANHYPLVV